MTSHTHRVFNLIRLLLLSLMFPWGGLCGGREEVLAKGWTLDLLIERFNQYQGKSIAYDLEHPPSKNWGGTVPYFSMLLGMIEKLGDRAALPFLEEKSLMTNAPGPLRARAAKVYASLATAEECAAFLPKILKVDDEDKTIISWRYGVTPIYLGKIEEAAAKGQLQKKTLDRLIEAFVTYTQSAYYSLEATWIDDYLSKHCEGYQTSKQRLVLATAILEADKENEKKREVWLPIKESVEAIPPRKRIDLRKRFPDLPPLPGDAPTGNGNRMKVAIAVAVVAGIVAVITVWFAVRWKKARKTT
jgi:hypothetical protein